MNFYEHHLGDYAKDAGHLSMTEDGAYRRLLDAYYSRETLLPADLKECCKLAKATSKPEREAVAYVLREFFIPTPEGWRHKRCDAEIARFKYKQERARASANARWQADKQNANAMRTHADEGCENDTNALRTHCEGNAPRARPQSPVTRHQEPEAKAVPGKRTDPEARALETATSAGLACRAMRDAGCPRTNPSHPDLLAALAEGVTADELADCAREGVEAQRGNVFAWAIATARGRHREGAKALAPASTGPPNGANPTSKTLSAIQTLEALKSDGLAQNRTADRPAEIALPQPGTSARA